jgi:hypothetical protein
VNAPHPAFCACCGGAARLPEIWNRPGLSQLSWRPGSYARFRSEMIAALGLGVGNPADPADTRFPAETRAALAALTSREPDDAAILLLSLFAAVGDVLGFYSERIVNEMFVGTARERDSLVRLARLIGYVPGPGHSAVTSLAFTLDAGAALTLRAGLKLMSVPGPEETPQVYETAAPLAAHAALNDLPAWGAPAPLAPWPGGRRRLPVRILPPGLKAGDTLVFQTPDRLEMHKVAALETAPDGPYLVLETAPGTFAGAPMAFRLKRELGFFGKDAPASWSFYDSATANLFPSQRWKTLAAGAAGYAVGRAARTATYPLDRKLDDMAAGAFLLADRGAGTAPRYVPALVMGVDAGPETLGPLNATVTRVAMTEAFPSVWGVTPVFLLGLNGLPALPDMRSTRLFELVPEAVVFRAEAYPDTASGGTLWVRNADLPDAGLIAKGRAILVSGGTAPHLATVTDVVAEPALSMGGMGHVRLGFTPPLPGPVNAARINANVVAASHGETGAPEPLGHGDGGRPFQRFRLSKKPLSRVPDAGPPRAALTVAVNGQEWREVPSLFGAAPTDRVFTLQTEDDGTSIVGFGDGVTGARLPSGALNIEATYRTGLGRAGRVRAGQLTTLLERPPGLRAATNPLPADGGADPDPAGEIAVRAPASVRTFGRAISLGDHEAVALETGLARRARASVAWVDWQQALHLSVAGDGGVPLSASALATVHAALMGVRDPGTALFLGNFTRVPLSIEARLVVEAGRDEETVIAGATAALLAFLDFARWPLGSALHLAQVSAALQGAEGVVAVDIERFTVAGASGWTPAQRGRRGLDPGDRQRLVRLFAARSPSAPLDPIAAAASAADPSAPVLPAELPMLADLSLLPVASL